MMGLVAVVVFTGAMALAVAAIWLTIAPQWRRIVRLAAGQVEQPFQPLADLAREEHRIAVRRVTAAPGAFQPVPVRATRLRAA